MTANLAGVLEARGEWAARCRQFVEGELGLRFPEVDLTWNG